MSYNYPSGSTSVEDRAPTYFLISGAPRSGTTALQNIVNSHPEAVCLHEFQLEYLDEIIHKFFRSENLREDLLKIIDPPMTSDIDDPDYIVGSMKNRSEYGFNPDEEYTALVENRASFTENRIGTATLIFRKSEHRASIINALFSIVSGKSSIRAFGDKVPNVNSEHYVRQLREAFPGLKIIYILRSPLHVIRSSMRRSASTAAALDNWPVTSIEEAIVEWAMNWEHAAREFAKNSADNLFIRYEDLLDDFDRVSAQISKFLNISPKFDNLLFAIPQERWDFHLTSSQTDVVRANFGSIVDDWMEKPLIEHLAETKEIFPRFGFGTIFNPPRQLNGLGIFRSGFDNIEQWGIWTTGNRAELGFRVSDETVGNEIWVTLTLTAWLGRSETVNFGITLPGLPTRTLTISAAQPILRTGFACPCPDGQVKISLFIPEPKKPHEEPQADIRALGIGITSIEIAAMR